MTLSELYHKKHLSLAQIIDKLSINPRKILNIPIPSFKAGEIANFTVLNPDEIWTVDISKFKSKSNNSPFGKKLINGRAAAVINKSKMYYEGEDVLL